jgi:hypothetical protein
MKIYYNQNIIIRPGGKQKINLLHKAGCMVVYFGYKHQRKVEKFFSNFNEKLKGVVKKNFFKKSFNE